MSARADDARRLFSWGQMSAPVFRATMHGLGFRGTELEAEVGLHWPKGGTPCASR